MNVQNDQTPSIRTEGELLAAITSIVATLRDVEAGDTSARVALPYPEAEPIGALAACVNFMTQALAERRDETFAYQQELEAQIGMIEKQRAAIRELSTPIIDVWRGVLCVPIVGVLDSSRASEMTSALLNTVIEKKARFIIIDVTGIDAMDTRATDHFLRMARAVRLLGAECVLSGVNPSVARTITQMGLDLQGLASYRTLRDALQQHVKRTRASSKR